jgi:dGTPase
MIPEYEKRFYGLNEDFRDAYARDRDRIIHSESFRKLEYKTQVFINHEGDFFRTRLTHSLEVSQVARSITKALGLNETLAEAIALAHDLGHTPFGHVGGDELDALLRADGFTNGFEHNYQSFRVITKLEKRYKAFDGLNLTYATQEGVLKHSYPYRAPFLDAKIDERFDLDRHPKFEAIVADFADEIAYISHDIDDGINSGLIGFNDLREATFLEPVFERVKEEGITEEDGDLFRYRFVAHLINTMVYTLLDQTDTKVLQERELKVSEAIPIGYNKETSRAIKILKKLLFNKLYQHEKIVRKMFAGKEAIKGLYRALMSDINLLPKSLHSRFDTRQKHRVIADYIASLSDRHALALYRELYGVR